MSLGVYTYILWGNVYNLPYREMIKSVLPIADEIVIITDPRCNDGTIETIRSMYEPKINLIIQNLDFDDPGVDGKTKALARGHCKSDILIQMDSDEIIDPISYEAIREAAKVMPSLNMPLIGTGVINYFNGEHLKYSAAGWTKERLSKNNGSITHGIPINHRIPREQYWFAKEGTTDGAGYISSESGRGLGAEEILCSKGNFPEDYLKQDHIWIHHYSWYSVPRKWQMKATWHYMWGNLFGYYNGLESYRVDRNGEPVNFWQPQRLQEPEYYRDIVLKEMSEKSIRPKPEYICHPEFMTEWLQSCQAYIFNPSPAWYFRRNHLMAKGRIK